MKIMQRTAHSHGQITGAAIMIVTMNEMDDDLGVGVAVEGIAFSLQFGAQFEKILHNAILHHDQIAVLTAVGMGVALAWRAMGRPTRMPQANRARHRCIVEKGLADCGLGRGDEASFLVPDARAHPGFVGGVAAGVVFGEGVEAGATVVATTRFPHDAAKRYAAEDDFEARDEYTDPEILREGAIDADELVRRLEAA